MEKIKNTLLSRNINIKYLNLDALYDHCGDDLIKIASCSKKQRSDEMNKLCTKYKKNLVINAFIRRFYLNLYPHRIIYDKKKYEWLFVSALDLNNRKIFTSIFEYFLGEDVIFLNLDSIYDEVENQFISLINTIRNQTYVLVNEVDFCKVNMNWIRPIITIFNEDKHDLMNYFDIWCWFMLAKVLSRDIIFTLKYCSTPKRRINFHQGIVSVVGGYGVRSDDFF